jgi:hypothetical protein
MARAQKLVRAEEYQRLKTAGLPFSFGQYVWAYTLCVSRVFRFTDDVQGMVPLADLLNHAPQPNVDWRFDPTSNCFLMRTNRILFPNTELTDSYGSKCNSRFFNNYGFIPRGSNESNQTSIEVDTKQHDHSAELQEVNRFYDDGYSMAQLLGPDTVKPGVFRFQFSLLPPRSSAGLDPLRSLFNLVRVLSAPRGEAVPIGRLAAYIHSNSCPVTLLHEYSVIDRVLHLLEAKKEQLEAGYQELLGTSHPNHSREWNHGQLLDGEIVVLRDLGQQLNEVAAILGTVCAQCAQRSLTEVDKDECDKYCLLAVRKKLNKRCPVYATRFWNR